MTVLPPNSPLKNHEHRRPNAALSGHDATTALNAGRRGGRGDGSPGAAHGMRSLDALSPQAGYESHPNSQWPNPGP